MLDGSVFLEMLEHPRKRIFDPVIADVQPTDATHLGDQRRYHVRTYRQAGAETLKPVIADVQPTDATHLGDQRRYHVRTYRQAGAETLKPPPIQKYSQKKLTGKQ